MMTSYQEPTVAIGLNSHTKILLLIFSSNGAANAGNAVNDPNHAAKPDCCAEYSYKKEPQGSTSRCLVIASDKRLISTSVLFAPFGARL